MKKLICLLVLSLIFLTVATAAAGELEQCLASSGPGFDGGVEVSGATIGDGLYRLAVRADIKPSPTMGLPDAIEFWSRPSNRLLATVTKLASDRDPLRHAANTAATMPWNGLAEIRTESIGRFDHAVLLPFRVGSDRAIEVRLRYSGDTVVVAQGHTNLSLFTYSSTFAIGAESRGHGRRPILAKITHCCMGGQCGRMCINCPEACFFCDLINCSIDCESPCFGPPK